MRKHGHLQAISVTNVTLETGGSLSVAPAFGAGLAPRPSEISRPGQKSELCHLQKKSEYLTPTTTPLFSVTCSTRVTNCPSARLLKLVLK